MAEKIFLIDSNDRLQPMEEHPYEREDVLQDLLARYPDLIPGDQIDEAEPRRWILMTREMAVPDGDNAGGRWSVDHLFLDQDGVPTFVETKRSSDTRLRREVLGQMLDYAANSVAYWSADMLRTLFEQRCSRDGLDPASELATIGIREADDFWTQVKTNLEANRLRLIFVADVIPRELRRIIEFLNEQMTTVEVLGVEIRQFLANDGRRTIVPRVLGQTEKAQQRKSGSSRTDAVEWTLETFLEKIETGSGREARDVAERLFHWSNEHTDRVGWNHSRRGSFVPLIETDEWDHYPFLVGGEGVVEIEFMWEKRKPPFNEEAKRREWVEYLNEIPHIQLDPKLLGGFPSIPLKKLSAPEAYDAFIRATEWAIAQMRQQTT